jgi:hypothetical protein
MQLIAETSPMVRGHVGETMEVSTVHLVAMLNVLDRVSNVIDLCKSIINNLDGKFLANPCLRPRSPLLDDASLERQGATIEEMEAFLKE